MCAGLAEELHLPPDAPGGMVDYRRTLSLSFFFKFYLTVLLKLGKDHPEDVSVGPVQSTDSLQHFCMGIWVAGVDEIVLWSKWRTCFFPVDMKGQRSRTRDIAQGATRRWDPTEWLRGRALGWVLVTSMSLAHMRTYIVHNSKSQL